jgi:hypothetical protein
MAQWSGELISLAVRGPSALSSCHGHACREEEPAVQIFTANYSRTWRPADTPFPESALDTAYVSRSQQNAIRRLDATQLSAGSGRPPDHRPPPGGAHIPGRMSESPAVMGQGISKTGLASSDSAKPCSPASVNPAPSPARSRPARS